LKKRKSVKRRAKAADAEQECASGAVPYRKA